MGRSAGRRVYDAYSQLPDGVRRQTDKLVKLSAKATRRLRDRKQIEERGRAWVRGIGKKARRIGK
jgi:predicted subunit of tRNA(5-methylaminomethyl-2-thiouridylate) methyltransferase